MINKKCQVFTPKDYVSKLLNYAGYKKNIYGKKILENSCGNGNILAEVVRRYIKDCNRKSLSTKEIKEGLENDIIGYEIDPERYKDCIVRLNKIINYNGIDNVNWKIYNRDFLLGDQDEKYDFVVGNPPYITYRDLNVIERKKIREQFESCQNGQFDYCYAFIEKSYKNLKQDGILSYLIPSGIFKAVFAKRLRDILINDVDKIYDYSNVKAFDKACVRSAIVIIKKNSGKSRINYCSVSDNKSNSSFSINKKELNDKWIFTQNSSKGKYRFGDYFRVSHAVATLYNNAYLLASGKCVLSGDLIEYNGYYIDRLMVKEAASPKTMKNKKSEMIIFPYKVCGSTVHRFSDQEFEDVYKNTSNYLRHFRNNLDKRASEKSTQWYEYGRSQALSTILNDKIMLSTIVSGKVETYRLKKECIPYSGMYIIEKTPNGRFKLEDAEKILSSADFFQYTREIGTHINGDSFRITSKDISNYMFSE